MQDWAAMTSAAISAGVGFDSVAALVDAGFAFFASHHDFVVIWRREAIEGGGRLERAMADHMRPFLDRAVAYLRREVAAGRLREHDPVELMQLVYGAVMTFFSDAAFRARLLDEDPLGEAPRERFRSALTATLRGALEPR
jgi:TetR/AcrR family transcriptional regulator